MKSFLVFGYLFCLAGAAQAATPGLQTVAARRLVEAARAMLPATAPDVKVIARVIGHPGDATVPAGSIVLKARAPQGRWPRARVAIPVSILLHGEVVQTDTVWFAIQALRDAWVYSKNEPTGTAASKLKPREIPVDVASAGGSVVQSLTTLANERLVRGVHAGWPLLRGDFEPIPVVDAQSRVVVYLRQGPIHLEVRAVALNAGNVGDTVSVLVNGATAPVQAKVMAKGVVDVAD
jgi:flagella basal body P-ring formation protein FlgA